VSDIDQISCLKTSLHEKPKIYAFILYGNINRDIKLANFVNEKGNFLDSITDDNCLTIVFENPINWGKYWRDKWSSRLGSSYAKFIIEWEKLDKEHRNISYEIARKFGIKNSEIPCIIFTDENFKFIDGNLQKKILVLGIIDDENSYEKFFIDIFDSVNKVLKMKLSSGDSINKLRSILIPIKIKWNIKITCKKVGRAANDVITLLYPVIVIIKKFLEAGS